MYHTGLFISQSMVYIKFVCFDSVMFKHRMIRELEITQVTDESVYSRRSVSRIWCDST